MTGPIAHAALLAALTTLSVSRADAATIFGQEFQLNSVAAFGDNFIQLTRSDLNFDRGSAFLTAPIRLDQSFELSFGFRILGGAGGADGMTVTFQNLDPRFVGLSGGNLGFYSPRGPNGQPQAPGPAVAVAFDTYRNVDYGDADDNHISVIDHSKYLPRAAAPAPWDLDNGRELFVWVAYDVGATSLAVFLSETVTKPVAPLLTDTIDLAAWIGNTSYVGWTAATGGLTNDHLITAFPVANPVPEPATWALLAAGLALLGLRARRPRQAA